MKKLVTAILTIFVFNFQFIYPNNQSTRYKFEQLSESSRPIEIRYIYGTDSQTGLIVGLFNHDSLELEVEFQRGTFLKSQNETVQSMLIAKNHQPQFPLLSFSSCYGDWTHQKSDSIYIFKLPPKQLTDVSLNAVCADLDKNPPSTTDNKFIVTQSENNPDFEKLFAAVDRINNQIVPGIEKAIVEKNGPNLSLNRNLTQREQIILSNLTDDMFLSLNTFNYAVWAIIDQLDKNKMQQKLKEWSGLSSTQQFDVQIEMTKIILEEAVLNEYAVKFE